MTRFFEVVRPLGDLAPWVVLGCAAFVFPVLFWVTAPYGRHLRGGWGPTLPSRWGWVVMESPSAVLFGALWLAHPSFGDSVVVGLGGLWLLHYLQRTFVYPALMRNPSKPEPVSIVAMAFAFNLFNASGNAVGLRARPVDAAFLVGALVFVVGFALNLHADAVLRGLRKPGETGYQIPHGGLHSLVAAPNYFAELVEWLGFAIAAQSLAGWAFAVFTFANLAPRAVAHLKWYRSTFSDYPASRRALIPYVW